MAPLYPSFTPTYHHDPYPAIDPSQPHLDCSSRIVLITGAGGGIGQSIALAFAKAHAKGIAILGRTTSSLEATADAITAISPSTDVFISTADITQPAQVEAAMASILAHYPSHPPDILVNNAGGLASSGRLDSQPLSDIWATFELNVKGPLAVAQAFSRAHLSPSSSPPSPSSPPAHRITLINLASGVVHLPYAPGAGAYASSKLAGVKLTEMLHHEHPEWNVFNLQPGVVRTELARRAGRKAPDAAELPANAVVWLCGDERARVLNGRFVWANWDVEEVLERGKEIEEGDLLTMVLKGWGEGTSASELMERARGVHRDAERG